MIIEHRLEDVLWRNVDRIILVNEGTILADMTPDELLSTSLLADNGIREPLYVTAMRYAGIDITKETVRDYRNGLRHSRLKKRPENGKSFWK